MHRPTNLGASRQRSPWCRLNIHRNRLQHSLSDEAFTNRICDLHPRARLQSDCRLLRSTDAAVDCNRAGVIVEKTVKMETTWTVAAGAVVVEVEVT